MSQFFMTNILYDAQWSVYPTKDDEIDFTDIPLTRDWNDAVVGKVLPAH